MTKILTIACSTLGNRLSDAVDVYHSLQADTEKVDFLIIHQIPQGDELNEKNQKMQQWLVNDSKIKYVPSYTKGLTKSRNIGIKNCNTKYIWIMDDDITFESNIVSAVQDCLVASEAGSENIEGGSACHTFESLKPSGSKRTRYPIDGVEINSKQLLRVASFEMILNKDVLLSKDIYFREDMGVGGNDVNLGEESVLISDLHKVGGVTRHHSIAVLTHPEISTGVIVDEKNFYSKGVVIKRCFEGAEKLFFYIRDVNRLLKNKKNEFGAVNYRFKLIAALTKGCFLDE